MEHGQGSTPVRTQCCGNILAARSLKLVAVPKATQYSVMLTNGITATARTSTSVMTERNRKKRFSTLCSLASQRLLLDAGYLASSCVHGTRLVTARARVQRTYGWCVLMTLYCMGGKAGEQPCAVIIEPRKLLSLSSHSIEWLYTSLDSFFSLVPCVRLQAIGDVNIP